MAEPMKSRFAIDLDDLERQLRDTASTQPKAPPADPLAELARIVGQDDPFKALFTDKPAARSTPAPASPSAAAPVPTPTASPASPRATQPVAPGPSSTPGLSLTPGPGARVEPSIDDLLRDFDLAMEKADAGMPKASVAGAAEPSLSPPPPSPISSASAAPVAMGRAPASPAPNPDPADPMVDAFDALLRDELRGSGRSAPEQRAFDRDTVDRVDDLARVDDRAPVDLDAASFRARDLDRDRETDPIKAGMAARDLRHQQRGVADDGFPDDEAPDYPEPPAEPVADMRSLEPQQPRKGLMIAAGLMGVAALGIGAVVGLGGLFGGGSPSAPGGEVPVVRAESGPAKVQPANPGGVDIPNQNKQIFERAGESKPADTRVVNREEQPMDVQAAARQAARVILPAPGADASAASTSQAQPPAGTPIAPGIAAAPPATLPPQATIQPAQPPALGEPRRVRTVSVRPDGTIAPPPGTPEAGNGAGNGSSSAPQGAAPAATPAPPSLRAAQPPATTGSAPVVRAPQPPAPPRAPADPSRQQVAAAPATPPVAAPATTPAAPPRAAEPAAPRTGGVMVQLAAPGSEAEARATFSALQRRHSAQLAGETPVFRRTEINGRTVYRIRIGPYASREEAASKCEAIRADGGQCFLATN